MKGKEMVKENNGIAVGLDFTSVIGPDALREMLAQGRPVLVIARNSNPNKDGVAEAILELKKTAEELRNKVGIDISAFLPSDRTITSAFKNEPTIRTKAEKDGKELLHKFVSFAPTPGLVILMGVGTGRGLSEAGQQPWVQRVVEQVNRSIPALLYAHRIDRLSRHMLSTSEVLKACQFRKTMVGEPQNGISLPDNLNSLMNLFLSSSGENEADKIPTSTRKGMKARTDSEMINGFARYACTTAPPAGLIRLRMKNHLGTQGDSVIVLDDPAFYPDKKFIFAGLPEAIVGQKISNMELVKWALANYGKPGHTKTSMGKYLAANYFSHSSYRRHKGVEATFHDFDRPGHLITALLINLAFYETGEFISDLGIDGMENVVVTGCMPPGGWATPEDFARIRKFVAQKPKLRGGTPSMAFTGVAVGDQGIHLQRAEERRCSNGPSYALISYKSGKTRAKVQKMPAIPHAALAGSLVEAIEHYAQRSWDPSTEADENTGTLQELEKAEQERSYLDNEMIKRREELTQRDENGNLLSVSVLNILAAELDDLENQARPRLNLKIQGLRASLTAKPNGDDVKGLLRLVASLHRPFDATQNKFWKDCLHIEKVSKSTSSCNYLLNTVIEWKGNLALSEGQNDYTIPFSGSVEIGALQANRHRVDAVIAKVINGDGPLGKIPMANPLAMRALIAEAFGYRGKFGGICGCPDAELQAILFTMLTQPELSDSQVAQRHCVQEQLIANLRTYTKTPPVRWQTTRKDTLTGLSQAIASGSPNDYYDQQTYERKRSIEDLSVSEEARDTLTISDGQLVIIPCECGSLLRLLSKIKGPQGFVCYDCGIDNAGVKWAPKYRQYLIGAQYLGIKEYSTQSKKARGTTSRKRSRPKNKNP
jgi:hypothetical protein